jgi:hypothetical protein
MCRPLLLMLAHQRKGTIEQPADAANAGGWSSTDGTSIAANISATQFALEALRSHDALGADIRSSALLFLAHCQNRAPGADLDGGFCFSPLADDPLNKAGSAGQGLRGNSYGTATADGLAAILTLGVPADDPRAIAATLWLERHATLPLVPSFERDDARSMAGALTFYYCSAMARCIRLAPESRLPRQAPTIISNLMSLQEADGSWRNSNTLMREDPSIATTLAVHALALLSQEFDHGTTR